MNYPADWVVSGDSLNSHEMSMITNVPTNTLLTSYIPSDGTKTVLSDAFYGSSDDYGYAIVAPPGQDYMGIAVNVGTDNSPVWQPLTLGVSGVDSLQDYQCLEDPSNNTLTFANPPHNLQNSVRLYYSINMWSGIVNFQIPNKTYIDFSIMVLHSPQTYEQWSQTILNSKDNLASQQTQLAGYPAYEVTSKGTDYGYNKPITYNDLRIWALINGKIYEVQADVQEPYQYSDYSALFFQMINSLHIAELVEVR
jgi:hypothetical protein